MENSTVSLHYSTRNNMQRSMELNILMLMLVYVNVASATEALPFTVELNGKKIGDMSASQTTNGGGQLTYKEETNVTVKKFFMTFAITSILESTYVDGEIVNFEMNHSFNEFKENISGKKVGSTLEILVQEDEEEDKSFVVDINSFELSDVTPPLLTYQLLKTKKPGDETTYLDVASGTVQGIKLLTLDEDNDVLTARYQYFGDEQFMQDNDGILTVSYSSKGNMVELIDESEGILVKQQ